MENKASLFSNFKSSRKESAFIFSFGGQLQKLWLFYYLGSLDQFDINYPNNKIAIAFFLPLNEKIKALYFLELGKLERLMYPYFQIQGNFKKLWPLFEIQNFVNLIKTVKTTKWP